MYSCAAFVYLHILHWDTKAINFRRVVREERNDERRITRTFESQKKQIGIVI